MEEYDKRKRSFKKRSEPPRSATYNHSLSPTRSRVQSRNEAAIWDISSRVPGSQTNKDNLYFPTATNLMSWSKENVFAPGYPTVGLSPQFPGEQLSEEEDSKRESDLRLRSNQRPIRVSRSIYTFDEEKDNDDSSHVYEELDGNDKKTRYTP